MQREKLEEMEVGDFMQLSDGDWPRDDHVKIGKQAQALHATEGKQFTFDCERSKEKNCWTTKVFRIS